MTLGNNTIEITKTTEDISSNNCFTTKMVVYPNQVALKVKLFAGLRSIGIDPEEYCNLLRKTKTLMSGNFIYGCIYGFNQNQKYEINTMRQKGGFYTFSYEEIFKSALNGGYEKKIKDYGHSTVETYKKTNPNIIFRHENSAYVNCNSHVHSKVSIDKIAFDGFSFECSWWNDIMEQCVKYVCYTGDSIDTTIKLIKKISYYSKLGYNVEISEEQGNYLAKYSREIFEKFLTKNNEKIYAYLSKYYSNDKSQVSFQVNICEGKTLVEALRDEFEEEIHAIYLSEDKLNIAIFAELCEFK